MARPATIARVHDAVLQIAVTGGPESLTMEGIAAKAGVGKQTLYRSWGSVAAILFDALLRHSAQHADETACDKSDLHSEVEWLLRSSIEEISTQPHEALLRSIAAKIQTDEETAHEFQQRLLRPQLDMIHSLLAEGGMRDAERAAELLIAPIFYRWFMRLPVMSQSELSRHVTQVLQLLHADP
ncbi:TetR/AcrR family transcriptional regulator [Hoyosella altamirensis]|uniref:AcrR family transcriptional regulator n=1 Tax=Hoyosella altamirensis TaxID=616997 RepID=A0A839RUG5_9ACTN|nr:TetR/AcrR family transcriptional regulator [Hoyosella altamirensis]MBB3039704.1 AcrR family transcriptional regulator [Hoyosella altamirensis]